MILNIETSSRICSVALCNEGDVWFSMQSDTEMDHATKLAPFVDECMQQLRAHDRKLDAVAVSLGPGSYTGLRIGLSLGKGLCFGLGLPLIGVPTLKLLAVKAMFTMTEYASDTVFVPMIDARRMEVYTAAYDISLNEVVSPEPLILTQDSYMSLNGKPLVMIGDGVSKARNIINVPVYKWIDSMPLASDMNALSDKAFREKDFLDIAYSTPLYLKNFQATTPKSRL